MGRRIGMLAIIMSYQDDKDSIFTIVQNQYLYRDILMLGKIIIRRTHCRRARCESASMSVG